ncbi:hypothetical protein [[Mycoplasma] collis]|uniref:hypothetical protein n=1 Tax=[Mycoplasma] collis TaxID=2127 RepID=UPI00051C7462|nr:hypothetical protein [[Mycoplasma] collis]
MKKIKILHLLNVTLASSFIFYSCNQKTNNNDNNGNGNPNKNNDNANFKKINLNIKNFSDLKGLLI